MKKATMFLFSCFMSVGLALPTIINLAPSTYKITKKVVEVNGELVDTYTTFAIEVNSKRRSAKVYVCGNSFVIKNPVKQGEYLKVKVTDECKSAYLKRTYGTGDGSNANGCNIL